MPSVLTSDWNYAVSYLELGRPKRLEQDVCEWYGSPVRASGFFWSLGSRTFLVTNWHVFAGIHDEKGACSLAGQPTHVRFYAFQPLWSDENHRTELKEVWSVVRICEDDYTAPKWVQHNHWGTEVDVAALDVTDAIADSALHVKPANAIEPDLMTEAQVTQDVYILGFPFGMDAMGHAIPIWKRASIASEPTIFVKGEPRLFVDTASREGMSGSIALVDHQFPIPSQVYTRAGAVARIVPNRFKLVLGVYSGRWGKKPELANLGIIWHRNLIEEVVRNGSPGEG